MSNEENKRNEVMDYSKFFERKKEKKVEIPGKKKRFSFGFRDFWFEMDKKTKVELIIFLIVVVITFGVFTFYFLERAKAPESSLYPSSQRVDFLPYEE